MPFLGSPDLDFPLNPSELIGNLMHGGEPAVFTTQWLSAPSGSQLLPPPPEGDIVFIWQSSITDELGNVVPGAGVEVRNADTNGLVAIYSNRAGTVALSNPFTADSHGYARFYAAPGTYRIRAFGGGQERIWSDVIIGVPVTAIIEAIEPTLTAQQAQISAIAADLGVVEDDLAELLETSAPVYRAVVAADGSNVGFPGAWSTSYLGSGVFQVTHGFGTTAYHVPAPSPHINDGRVHSAQIISKLSNSFQYRHHSIFDEADGGTAVPHDVVVFGPTA
jgi:hypothetical protein